MKKLLTILSLTVSPSIASATALQISAADDGIVFASMFTGDFSLLLSILIGIIATTLVFRAAKKMGGGLFGLVLKYIGFGMLFIVMGSLTIFLNPWVEELWLRVFNTIFFAFGYIFMVIGANKLLKGLMNS